MKNFSKILGMFFLGVSAFIAVIGPASLSSVAAEDMPESMKSQR